MAGPTSFEPEEGSMEWKQSIREQVEEDLERQVRLRLKTDEGIDCKKHYITRTCLQLQKKDKKEQDNVVYTLSQSPMKQKEKEDGMLTQLGKEKEDGMLSQFVVKRKEKEEDKMLTRESAMLMSTTKSYDCHDSISSVPAFAEIPQNNIQLLASIHDGDEISLPPIFDYVNINYGTPKSQLKVLLEQGSYKTRNVICGKSELVIKCPVESRVFLPTPNHRGHDTSCDEVLVPDVNFGLIDGHVTFSRGSLQFESRFESGNLLRVAQMSSQEYIIWLAPDLYTKHYMQWFYFRVRGMVAEKSYTFHIANFYKSDSLYNYGMQPLLYSEKMATCGSGWIRVGDDITYHRTDEEHLPKRTKGTFYTLTWTMKFPYSEDTCYFAHCFPYPYSQLLSYLSLLQDNSLQSRYISREVLCYTVAGNCCPLLTITNFDETEETVRMGVVITARVHPGETNSSWMMEGLIDFLTSESEHAMNLRNHYVFKLVPMLNPDGVIVGNYRTSLSGVDLNRVYKVPRADLFPTIYHTKKLIAEVMSERKLVLYVDLHGHSRKQNVFTYGCHAHHCNHFQLLDEHVIPYLLSQQAPQMFDYKSCKFTVQKCKEATGRVVTWRMGVPNSFTMESTFYGSTLTDEKRHFSIDDLRMMGCSLGEVVHSYHHYIENEGYRRRLQSKIADHILKSKADLLQTSSLTLPPIVMSNLNQAHLKVSKLKKKSRVAMVLNMFMKFDTSVLEQESCTSGSDSEDDEFSWKASKKVKNRRMKSKPTLELTQLVEKVNQLRQKLPCNKATTMYHPDGRLHGRKSQEQRSTLQPNVKFVNKYQNLHGGGMPIFAEKRLQERKEKVKNSRTESHVYLVQQQKPSSMWKINAMPASSKPAKKNEVTRESIGHLKLSAELTKYIHETWSLS